MHDASVIVCHSKVRHLICWQLLKVEKKWGWYIFISNTDKPVSVCPGLLVIKADGMPHFMDHNSLLQIWEIQLLKF